MLLLWILRFKSHVSKVYTSVLGLHPLSFDIIILVFNYKYMCAEPLSCLFQLKSATEDAQVEQSSAICLLPGNGDYHVL